MAEQTIALPVVEVTLLEDRAMVVRRGPVTLAPGRTRVCVEGIAPVLVDKTLTASLKLDGPGRPDMGESQPRVLGLRVERRLVTRESERSGALATLETERRAQKAKLDAANEAHEDCVAAAKGLARLHALSLSELAEDVSWGQSGSARWEANLDALEHEIRETALERCRLEFEIARLERASKDLAVHVAAESTIESESLAELRVDLDNPGGEALALELSVEYLVPGALWRPWHTARLIEAGEDEGGEARIEFRCDAAVWQATGEDWNEAQLLFSTERPSLGVAPPSLSTDRLRMRKRSSSVEVEVREQKVNTAGLGAEDGPAKTVAEDELPGIDDGGEALELRGRSKASIPGDGRPHRVPIFSFEASAETALVCAPEQVLSVMLRSRQLNASEYPLLAGPVDLVRNSGLVGRSSLLYIAPGERFELGWGPDSSLRVHREVEEGEHERRMMSSWTRKPRRIKVKLSNLGAVAKTIEIKERVPVSEVEKVEVEIEEISMGAKPDSDGFVTWELRLRGYGQDELASSWVLVVHDDVVGL